jgi:hypothetical protein
MSPLGGDDRRLNDAPVAPPLAWAPDGRHLAARYWRQPAVRASEVSISLRSPVTSHVRSRAPRAG